jgi:hypothetical protein
MTDKEPVLLTVLVETSQRRWFVAGITLDGQPVPLIRSAVGNLDPYVGTAPDEQVNFLRHRLSGVLQRGCDRLWGRQMKPCQIIFVAETEFESGDAELTRRVAEHFVVWMSNPPVVFFTSENGFPREQAPELQQVAGELNADHRQALNAALPQLAVSLEDAQLWELAPSKPTA